MAACPACASEQKDGARFCDQCGAPQQVACTNCGSELRPGARFCDQCGASQDGAVAAAGPRAASAPHAPTSERRVTSVLFGDLVGFTTLSEQRDKEDVRELLSDYFAQCRRIVARYGGTIEKFIGDAVMAVWGVPIARDDDAERAVRAGLELVRAIEELGEQISIPGLAMRVGIVTGEVAVNVGAQLEGMVAGDAVNTAARVQSVASPGEVWVDESTRLLTSGAITYSDAGSHELKGKAEPMPLWAVRAVVAAVGGSQRADGLEAPLTGRGREIRVIKELFHDVQENRRPALVVVSGDPGLGKSRLAWEFEKYIDGLYDSVAWHSTRCLAYGDGVAYWPIAEAVRGRLGLVESDQDADPGSALDAWLTENVTDDEETAWIRPRVLALLGGGVNSSFEPEDLFSAWRTFLERAGGNDSVSLVIDDAQHADDGTMRFVEHILANSDAPLFVMLLARSGLLQRWPDLATNRRATVLHLASLESREMSALLDGLVSGLPHNVRDGLVDRAQGVPLYAIETVRSLIDRDLVVPRGGVYVLADGAALDVDAIGAPASLQAVVAARLDQLSPAERRVVADASVFGLTFSREALAALGTDVANLDDVLTRLTRTEIFGTVTSRLSAEYGQFRFVQDVVRQVAYNTQSRRDRKAKHLAVAEYLSAQPDAGEVAPVLAQHYLDAIEASGPGDTDLADLRRQATEQLRRAGSRAVVLGAWVDARRYYESALAQADDPAMHAALQIELARTCFESGDADGVDLHARPAMEYYESAGDAIEQGHAAAYLAMSTSHLRGDNTTGLQMAQPHWDALRHVRGAERVLLLLGRAIGVARQNMNDIDYEVLLARASIADAVGDREAFAHALGSLAVPMLATSPLLAELLCRDALDFAVESQVPRIAANSRSTLANMLVAKDIAESMTMFKQCREEGRRSGTDALNLMVYDLNVATRGVALGSWADAEHFLTAAYPQSFIGDVALAWVDAMYADATDRPRRFTDPSPEARDADDPTLVAYALATEMYEARDRGELATAARLGLDATTHMVGVVGLLDDMIFIWPDAMDAALQAGDDDALQQLFAIVDEVPPGRVQAGHRAFRERIAALVAVRDGAADEVEPHFHAAIRNFEEWGSTLHAARARAEYAAWLDTLGRGDEAAVARQAALAVLTELDARGWLRRLGLDGAASSATAQAEVPQVSAGLGGVT